MAERYKNTHLATVININGQIKAIACPLKKVYNVVYENHYINIPLIPPKNNSDKVYPPNVNYKNNFEEESLSYNYPYWQHK